MGDAKVTDRQAEEKKRMSIKQLTYAPSLLSSSFMMRMMLMLMITLQLSNHMLKLQFNLWCCLRVDNFSPYIDIVHISQSIIICARAFSLLSLLVYQQ
ncbi:MAG: hypothetical protein M3299_07075 [Thermoproteota archaeon]|nr:hypothetical protein [Thermoproteota archaeon]